MSRALSHEQARAFYDHFGAKQDWQRFYEDPAIAILADRGRFEEARAVVEFGCGTGRLAERLLERRLRHDATYLGLDVSPTMIGLASETLRPWADRARAQLTDGAPIIPVPSGACDRLVSTYVFDLLSEGDIRQLLAEARRVLRPDGRLCVASLTFGRGLVARGVCRLWTAVHDLRPQLVGGCRPLALAGYLGPDWRVIHSPVVCRFAICTEVVVASPVADGK